MPWPTAWVRTRWSSVCATLPRSTSAWRHCLIRARELASSVPLPQAEGHGRGYACGIYERDSFVAVSADVHVDRASGQISVLRMCCAQDVGLAINPDQLRAQVESNLIWGIGMALMEKVEVDGSGVSSTNFDTYRIPRISHAPEFEIEIVRNPGIAPAGAGGNSPHRRGAGHRQRRFRRHGYSLYEAAHIGTRIGTGVLRCRMLQRTKPWVGCPQVTAQ